MSAISPAPLYQTQVSVKELETLQAFLKIDFQEAEIYGDRCTLTLVSDPFAKLVQELLDGIRASSVSVEAKLINPLDLLGKKIMVYPHFPNNGLLGVYRDLGSWKLSGYVTDITLADPKFKVRLEGEVSDWLSDQLPSKEGNGIYLETYAKEIFFSESGHEWRIRSEEYEEHCPRIYGAKYVRITPEKVWAIEVTDV
ncbi:hypothetical protein H6G00_01890 [Leptolyngbya sp. FACHB-541]|uniref:hypothetical protein n=1 Tax=Leptolyngbya sp. FACHB-541 TaxID=2692810 RepID=UPI001686A79C|nr:hypothetical protein [Leptolyngbya sp. FACHB-541]MBD1995383.1 hypothetical protein [Leptolyngbya sp. FACHB-541]